MTGFLLSPAAQNDIADIWDFTLKAWGEAQAERYLMALRDACTQLAAGTRISRPADDIRHGYRKCAVGSHVLFFRTDDAGTLSIIRILHRSMDLPEHL